MDIVNVQEQHVVLHASDFGVVDDGGTTEWKTESDGPYSKIPPTLSTITFVDSGIQTYNAEMECGVGIRCKKYAGLLLKRSDRN